MLLIMRSSFANDVQKVITCITLVEIQAVTESMTSLKKASLLGIGLGTVEAV